MGAAATIADMSIPGQSEELLARVAEFGALAYLVTVGVDTTPHVVSVSVGWDDGEFVVGAGRRTSTNVATNADVTLLWPARAGAAPFVASDRGRSSISLPGIVRILPCASYVCVGRAVRRASRSGRTRKVRLLFDNRLSGKSG